MNLLDWQVPANDNERRCEQCDALLDGPSSKRYCGKACSSKAYRLRDKENGKHPNDGAPEHVCEHCGDSFRRRKDKNNAARFCSRECGFAAGSNLSVRQRYAEAISSLQVSFTVKRSICSECGKRFDTQNISVSFCSQECRGNWARSRAIQARSVRVDIDRSERECPECGKRFIPEYGRAHAKYCSDKCSWKNNKRRSKARRRARTRGATNDNFDPIEILKRDRWRCQLCGTKTPRRLRGSTDPRAPELDHIIPLAMGGSHTRANTQCACRQCNGAKGAKIAGQMRLFG
ncbi:HNH endonuclease [Ochrobactrum sp. RH2CCR150]|uniref:HNH endonuclease n=1 Tax=Ochrobactrum sp. RH2CCR150 TaxID=2587044 RepID=UPI0015FA34C5